MNKLIIAMCVAVTLFSCKDAESNQAAQEDLVEVVENDMNEQVNVLSTVEVKPISHATFAMQWDDQTIYFDPVGGASAFENVAPPDLILVTDIHGDHFNEETLAAVKTNQSNLVVPQAVADQLGSDWSPTILNNGATQVVNGITITAIPMYNITQGRLQNHPKGRGNGYVLEKDGYRVYISGDTEGIDEMRSLQNIDKAFVCMNLPYTMDVEQAADAVLDFAPKEIVPYHYRGTQGLSNIDKFKEIVTNGNDNIEVTFLDWYPSR